MTQQAKRSIDVGMSDTMRFTPERIAVKLGETVRFVARNDGKQLHEFVIGTSLERIELGAMNLMAILFPRTSTNRRGIDLSLSGIIDTGYKGHLIFPMKNEAGDQVIRVYPGERVCQVIFQELNQPLTAEEANLHGLTAAKYTESGSQGFKLDKQNERDLLITGQLQNLKTQFKL